MAKPQMLFGYQPPAAMSMMGQGVAEGMAKVGELYGKGMQSFGEQIGSGLQSLGKTMGEQLDAKKTVSALEKTAGLIQDEEQRDALLGMLKDDNISNRQKAQMGFSMFNTLLDYGLKAKLQKDMLASRETIAGMRAGGGGGGGETPVAFRTQSLNQ